MPIRARAAVGVAVVAAVAIVSGAVLVASPAADHAPACAPTADPPGWAVAPRRAEAPPRAVPRAVATGTAGPARACGGGAGRTGATGSAAPATGRVTPPLIVALPQIKLVDPNRWQPLQIEYQVSQNGVVLPSSVQQAVGPHWGHVTPFAVPAGGASGVPFDPGPQPRLGDPSTDALFKSQAVQVIRDSSLLDPTSATSIDVSPGALGANGVGSNDGHGRAVNPATGRAYAPQLVRQGDFYRTIAEFWADGPGGERGGGRWAAGGARSRPTGGGEVPPIARTLPGSSGPPGCPTSCRPS